MGTIASQITSITIVYSTVYSDADQRKHLSSASLAFVRGIHRRPVNSPHKWPVTRKMFPSDNVIMYRGDIYVYHRSRYELIPAVSSAEWAECFLTIWTSYLIKVFSLIHDSSVCVWASIQSVREWVPETPSFEAWGCFTNVSRAP